MRNLFVILIMLIFVVGHGLSDVAAHLQVDAGNGTGSMFSAVASVVVPSGLATKDSGSKNEPSAASDLLHCTSYCGIVVATWVSTDPDIKPDVFERRFSAISFATISDHFRPPIG